MTTRFLLLAAASVLATGCLEGRPAPEPTEMFSITSGLTFTFGDEGLCESALSAGDDPVDCDDVRHAGEGETFQIAKAFPTATVVLKPFAIDRHEVTNVQYEYCVESGDCAELEAFNAANIPDYYRNTAYGDYPVLNVTWEQAAAYCAAQGKRLPTQFEWERAAGGPTVADDGTTQDPTKKRRYPYASDTDEFASCRTQSIALGACGAGSNPVPVTNAGFDQVKEGSTILYGFAGNVAEWVIDYRVEDLTCERDLACPDCWNCTTEGCFDDCYNCDACWDAPGDSCYALCKGDVAGEGLRGYPVCFRYEEPLFCALNAQGASECCRGDFADKGGTDCEVATPADNMRSYRGGSYLTSAGQTCTIRSGDRSQGAQQNSLLPQGQRVGFRCARSL